MNKPYAGVMCRLHGSVDIDLHEYQRQMQRPNDRWTCPICRSPAEFDDERWFEPLNPEPESEDNRE